MRTLHTAIATSALALVTLLAACGTSVSTPSVSPDQIINKVKAASPQAIQYTMEFTTSDGTLSENVAYTKQPPVIDYSLPTNLNGKDSTLETIQTTADTFMRTGDSPKWLKVPTTKPLTPADLDPVKVGLQLVGSSNPTYIGSETVNGKQTYHLRATIAIVPTLLGNISSASNSNYSGTADIWVRQDTFYIAKETTSFQGKSASGKDESGSFNLNVMAWDNDVKISIPTNIAA
jgi:hypothetical protein